MRRIVPLMVAAAVAAGSAAAGVAGERGFPRGECTEWAYVRRPAIVDLTVLRNLSVHALRSGSYVGAEKVADWDAWLWAANARKGGFTVGSRPAAGAIVVWPRNTDGAGPIGHVAYVQKVLAGGAFVVTEQNWNGRRYPTSRTVPANASLRFIYRRAGEPKRVGSGRILAFTSSYGTDGMTPSATFRLSGRADVLLRLLGPHGFVKEAARALRAGTTTLTFADIAGGADLAPGTYTLIEVVAGGGGNYQYLYLTVT